MTMNFPPMPSCFLLTISLLPLLALDFSFHFLASLSFSTFSLYFLPLHFLTLLSLHFIFYLFCLLTPSTFSVYFFLYFLLPLSSHNFSHEFLTLIFPHCLTPFTYFLLHFSSLLCSVLFTFSPLFILFSLFSYKFEKF